MIIFCIGYTIRSFYLALFPYVDNPYIKAHRQQVKNSQDYDEYIKWADVHLGGEMPYDKVVTDEERRMKDELGMR